MARLVDVQTITDGGSNVVTIGTDLALNGNAVALAPDLASTANGDGAALIGVEDSAANFTATTVEGVLAELQTNIDNSVGNDVHFAQATITFDGGATQVVATNIPLNAVITDVRINVTTVWDGSGYSITIGDVGQGTSVLADSDDFNLASAGLQTKFDWHAVTNGTNSFSVFYTSGTETQGSFDIIIMWTQA